MSVDDRPGPPDRPGTHPTRYARGWHCLGLAGELRRRRTARGRGVRHEARRLAGRERRAQRARRRTAGTWAATCRGARCRATSIACPFHGWRWGGDGRCQQIPYARRIPPRARTRTWPVLVQNGHLFVWHDPEGQAPPEDVTIPDVRGLRQRRVDLVDVGARSSSRTATRARSSTTWSTWPTSSTSTRACRRTSRTSSRATSRRSTTRARPMRRRPRATPSRSGVFEGQQTHSDGDLLRAQLPRRLAGGRVQRDDDRVDPHHHALPGRPTTASCCSTG